MHKIFLFWIIVLWPFVCLMAYRVVYFLAFCCYNYILQLVYQVSFSFGPKLRIYHPCNTNKISYILYSFCKSRKMSFSNSVPQKNLRYVNIKSFVVTVNTIYIWIGPNHLNNIFSVHFRRGSGFVGRPDHGTNVDSKERTDSSDGTANIFSRRQSRIFSMDLSDFGADEDHDKIVNKYKQVSYSQIATFLLIWNSISCL